MAASFLKVLSGFSKSKPKPSPDQSPPALHIPELVEMIFSNLRHRDLIQCSQVSKQWKDIVDTSPAIRRQTWRDTPKRLITRSQKNTLLDDRTEDLRNLKIVNPDGGARGKIPIIADLCPVFLQAAGDFNGVFDRRRTPALWILHPNHVLYLCFGHDISKRLLDHGYQCKTASYHEMLVMDPPQTQIIVRSIFYNPTRAFA
ncbi:uncharacterized protein BDZ99DRAFT_570530 [Mytilinidion resinicola]|uniref:F-box domain-containing protein n=1 Tax=Mytilinidion resinicola TaxID=574789 RepID=A0A6A6YLX6_9PEZI|nr:uncharacterized protein BDZ99DRAFT_570530 [Mytilinidion resinicola]KAF2809876.1 hypothetical protein BDZ99DRAFT_570530 [Mytilinidion resinicola]